MRIGILGPLDVRDADGRPLVVGGARLRSFLIRLAVAGGRPVPVDRLAEDLWAGHQPADAANAIQALASRLRAVTGRDSIEYGPVGYRLAVGDGCVDALAFEQQVADARSERERGADAAGAARLRRALDLWRGPALADVADFPFAAPLIARLTELWLAATEDRIDADLALGRGAGLIPEVEQLANEHPLRERLRGQQMRALQAAGRQADALAVFEDTRRALADELGIDPSPRLAAVHLAILRGQDDRVAAAPARDAPAPTAAPGHHDERASGSVRPPQRATNLPAQLTSFVGRDDELQRVSKLLEGSRLITLIGPGGAGKTRLAVESAAQLAPPDGVWFVPLAPVRDQAEVPQAVLTAIGAHALAWPSDAFEAARLAALHPLDRLSETLAARDLVLVLDNCEHLIEAAATVAARLLADAPGVRILTTSREPLGVTGETLSPVPSLPLPPPDAGLAELAGSPAVRLLADRAGAVRPGFTVTEANAGAVGRICRALDGIPLAIELAAARLRSMTPDQVADRLDDRFALLSVATRGTLPRHQTLRAIVDWSWDLLDDTERMILRRLSIFSGGATPESAQQVCWPGSDRDVVEVIASLLDKSLVTADGDSHVRYRLLETVRVYAAERLAEAGETGQTAAAHAAYFLALAERAEPEVRSRDQLIWLSLLMAEHDNFSAAVRYLIEAGDGVSLLRLVAALVWYLITHDFDTEVREWGGAAMRLAPAAIPPELTSAHAVCHVIAIMSDITSGGAAAENMDGDRLRAALAELSSITLDSAHPMLALVGPMLAAMSGNAGAVRSDLAKIADHPDPWVRAARLLISGHLAVNTGDIDEAAADLAQCLAAFDDIGDRFGIMVCVSGMAEVAMARNEPAEAVVLLERARALAAEGLARNWAQTVRVPLGKARAAAGDRQGGRAEIAAAVRESERMGEIDDAAIGFVWLSDLSRKDGDLDAAAALVDRAMAIVGDSRRRPDLGSVAAICLTKLGCVAEQRGDLAVAGAKHREALILLADNTIMLIQSHQSQATVVEGIAALAAARGQHTRAAELLGLAHTLQGYRNYDSFEVDRVIAASPLSPSEFDAAYAAGRQQGPADALALADSL